MVDGSGVAKRAMDVALLAVAATLLAPLGLGIAFLIRATMGRPVLFRQARLGRHGKRFDVIKFRTMTNERDGNGILRRDADRLTPVGRCLRKASLDEIPQLINVARGEMSFVGPRPLFVEYQPYYTERELARHSVRPGITGLAQTSGRNALGWNQRLSLDVQYARSRSFWGDLRLIWTTALQTVKFEGVSVVAGSSGDRLDIERSYPRNNGFQLRRLYARDLAMRVAWMNDRRTRSYMRVRSDVSMESTIQWYNNIQNNCLRNDFAVERADGSVVAMAGLRAREPGEDGELYVFVAPEHQGKGLGSYATDLTLQWCRSTRVYPGVSLSVARGNLAAIAIYRRRGFTVSHENERRIWMRLDLVSSGVTN